MLAPCLAQLQPVPEWMLTINTTVVKRDIIILVDGGAGLGLGPPQLNAMGPLGAMPAWHAACDEAILYLLIHHSIRVSIFVG